MGLDERENDDVNVSEGEGRRDDAEIIVTIQVRKNNLLPNTESEVRVTQKCGLSVSFLFYHLKEVCKSL